MRQYSYNDLYGTHIHGYGAYLLLGSGWQHPGSDERPYVLHRTVYRGLLDQEVSG